MEMVSSTVGWSINTGWKAPFECGIFFNMFAIFIECRRADTMQLSAREHRF